MNKKVVIVTGASSGIGFTTAMLFAKKGYQVYGLSRRKIEDAPFIQIQADVNSDSSVKAAVAEVLKQAGRIDILFNNAGFAMVGATEESSMDQIKSMFETNFFGAIRVANAVLPTMRKQRSGRILHTSSIAGLIPFPYMSYYSASKHALDAYSESLDHEIRNFGIRSILIEPSFMKTSINAHQFKVDVPVSEYVSIREKVENLVAKGIEISPSPDLVAEKVIEVAELVKPRLRYLVGKDAKILSFMRRFSSSSFFDKRMRSQLKLS